MLLQFGFSREYISIYDFYPDLFGFSDDEIKEKFKDFDVNFYLNKICNNRYDVIKKLGYELRKYINRYKYNYKFDIINIENIDYNNINNFSSSKIIYDINNPLDIAYNNFKEKIKVIKTEQKEDNKVHEFLKYINIINDYLMYKEVYFDDIKFNYKKNINFNYLTQNDYCSSLTLNYIIDEIIRLINFNDNRNLKTNIINFVIHIIIIIFNKNNFEVSRFNSKLNIFHQLLYTSEILFRNSIIRIFN